MNVGDTVELGFSGEVSEAIRGLTQGGVFHVDVQFGMESGKLTATIRVDHSSHPDEVHSDRYAVSLSFQKLDP